MDIQANTNADKLLLGAQIIVDTIKNHKLGKTVIDEYTKSGYPITTEILKFTDEGVKVMGNYSIR